MKPEEIKQEIDILYDSIEEAMSRGIFVLNPEIAKTYERIEELQNQCPHKFDAKGYCEYCYGSKEDF